MLTMTKDQLAAELSETLEAIRANTNVCLVRRKDLQQDLEKLPKRTLRGLIDVFYILRLYDEELFKAFSQWCAEDAGGDALMNHVPDRLGYHKWLTARCKETIGGAM
jgi:NTP pyrophosphatase (non-canonical NTP hydrolase)